MAGKKPKIKKNEAPPVDKLIKPAIGVALAIVAYQFIRGLGGGVSDIRGHESGDELTRRTHLCCLPLNASSDQTSKCDGRS